jgi:transposase
MDNPGSYKAIRQFIRVAGVKLFIQPKYAPDLHPIEQIFAELKHLLSKVPHALSKLSAPQLLEPSRHSSPTNAQIISKFFRLCVNLIAVMHVARA